MKYIFTAIIVFIAVMCMAQNASIRGNVYDSETGEPIIFGNVLIQGTTKGAVTDDNGFFVVSNLDEGKYSLLFRYLGYDSLVVEVSLRKDQIFYDKFYMNPSGLQLQTVNVTGRKEIAQNEVTISKLSVSSEEIKLLPATGGEPDIAQYLPVLPGVIFTGDQGGQLYIRGGTPIQNKILMDGMTIYNPFHSIGFFSVFETEAIRNIDVYTAGFGSEYGSRTSAIVDITTRDGNANRFGGLVSLSPFQGKVLLEGPLLKLDKESGRSVSYLVTGKKSIIQETSKTLYEYASDSLGLPFEHQDIYAKMSFNGGNGSQLDVFGFNFTDDVNFDQVAQIDWNSSGGGLNFSLIPRANNMVVNGKFNFSGYEIGIDEGDGNTRNSSINSFEIGLDFNSFGNNREINYGFELAGINTDFQFVNFSGIDVGSEQNTNEIGAFINYRQVIGGLVIEPGVRFQYYNAQGISRAEPRLGIKYNISDNLRIKAGGGFYSQNLLSTSNDRDVVNLFYGILTGPEEELFEPGTNNALSNNLQLSKHAVIGLEIDLGKFTTVNIEPYIKDFSQIINLNRNKRSPDERDYITEVGDARGIDFSLKHDAGDLYIWTTYSLGMVERDNGDQTYYTNFDRRHNANILVSYSYGLENQWEASARWNLGSGFPFTLTQGFYGSNQFEDGVNSDVETENPDLGIIYDEKINGGRLPYYHRLDLTLKRKFKFSKYTSMDIIASVTNAYDRDNIFFFDRIEYERVDQLPIIPSLGVTFRF